MDLAADLVKKNFCEWTELNNFSFLAIQILAYVNNRQDGGVARSKCVQYE